MIRLPYISRQPRAPFSGLKGIPFAPKTNVAWSSSGALQAAVSDAAGSSSWWTNYRPGAQGVSAAGITYIPMFFSSTEVTSPNIDTVIADAGKNGWCFFLNEPNADGTSVADAITAWNTLTTDSRIIEAGIQFVAPAATDVGGPNGTSLWLSDFLSGISNPPQIISIHAYTTPANITTRLNLYASTYPWNAYLLAPYRFWLSEFGPTADLGLAGNEAAMLAVYRDLIGRNHRCDRFAWYFGGPKDLGSSAYPWRAEYENDGTVTALGTYWKNLSIANLK